MLRENKVFRNIFIAYGLATLGGWFDFVAVAILFGFVWNADPLTIALLPIMYAGPGILFAQFAGILADRWNKLQIMFVTDIIRAIFTLGLIFAPNPLWALPLIFCRSVANVFHTPAQQAMTRHVVSEEQLLKATTLNGTVFQMGKVLGPLIGGTVAAVAAPWLCMLINVCCFLSSACFLRLIKSYREDRETMVETHEKTAFSKVWQEGWTIILGNRLLISSMLFSLIGIIAIQMVDSQFTVVLREKAPEHQQLVGWLIAAIGIGALVTVTWFNRYNRISGYGWLLGGGMVMIGILFAFFGLYEAGDSIWWLIGCSLLGGLGTGLTSVVSNYLLQKETPKEAIGRVVGIFDSIQSAVFIIAPLCGGLLINAMGASQTFRLIGYIIVCIGLLGILLQRFIWGFPQKNKKPARELEQHKLTS